MAKDIYTLDEKDGFNDDWHIVLKNGEYYAEFTEKDEAEKFILQKNGDTVAVKVEDLKVLDKQNHKHDGDKDWGLIDGILKKYLAEAKQ